MAENQPVPAISVEEVVSDSISGTISELCVTSLRRSNHLAPARAEQVPRPHAWMRPWSGMQRP